MANGYDPSEMYDVNLPALTGGYVNADAMAAGTMQREMLRRAQFQQQAQEQARQAMLDQQANELRQAQLANTKENTASQIQTRTAQAQDIADKQNEREYKILTSQTKPGDITKEQYDAGMKNPYVAGMLKIVPAKPAVPGTAAVAAPVDPDSGLPTDNTPDTPAVPAQDATAQGYSYAGTPEQQAAEEHDVNLKKAASGEFKKDPRYGQDEQFTRAADYLEQEAVLSGMGIKSKDQLAAVMKPKGAGAPTKEQRLEGVFKIHYDRAIASGMSPEDATLTAEAKLNKGEAQPVDDRAARSLDAAMNRFTQGQANTDRRQDARELDAARGKFGAELVTAHAKEQDTIDRVDRLQYILGQKNFTADSVAAPEFLQIVAGGMGSGLRMTEAELNRVQSAQSVYNQKLAQLAKWVPGVVGDQTIRDEMRNQMKIIGDTIAEAKEKTAQDREEVLRNITGVKDQTELNNLHANYWMQARKSARIAPGATPAAPVAKPPTAGTTETPEARYKRLVGGG